jgi:U3 small nucleolar RNA-associated protein 21
MGSITMWNMQSGLKRKTFDIGPPPTGTSSQMSSKKTAGIRRSITGLASDALNRIVIASTLDGTINVSQASIIRLDLVPYVFTST